MTDLNDIATFVQVVRYGSFAEASRRMGVMITDLLELFKVVRADLTPVEVDLAAMAQDAVASGGAAPRELRVDGGACVNDLLMQFQADLLGIPVIRPAVTETTALGAAYLAGLSHGIYSHTDELAQHWQAERTFCPTWTRDRAQERMAQWEKAVRQCTAL